MLRARFFIKEIVLWTLIVIDGWMGLDTYNILYVEHACDDVHVMFPEYIIVI